MPCKTGFPALPAVGTHVFSFLAGLFWHTLIVQKRRMDRMLQFPDSVERFVDPFHANDRQSFKGLFGNIGFRDQRNGKAQFDRFTQTVLPSGCRADFPRQSDFAENDQSAGQRLVAKR